MLTKLLKTLNESRYSIKSGAYFQRTLHSAYKHHEKYLEIRYRASLKNKVLCKTIDAGLPLSQKGLRNVLGTPRCVISNSTNPGVEIMCYRLPYGRFESEVEFHLYQDALFFYNYSFTAIPVSKQREIIQFIRQKHLNNETFSPDHEVISDHGALISIETGFNLNIRCFSSIHQPILDEFSAQIRNQKKNKRRVDHKQQLVYQGL